MEMMKVCGRYGYIGNLDGTYTVYKVNSVTQDWEAMSTFDTVEEAEAFMVNKRNGCSNDSVVPTRTYTRGEGYMSKAEKDIKANRTSICLIYVLILLILYQPTGTFMSNVITQGINTIILFIGGLFR